MIRLVHNWIAVVAVLAVAMLGVLAIDKAADSRTKTMRAGLVNICLRQNEARVVANGEIKRLKVNRDVLRQALGIAGGENSQRVRDRVAYARLQALLGDPESAVEIPTIDCEQEIPHP